MKKIEQTSCQNEEWRVLLQKKSIEEKKKSAD